MAFLNQYDGLLADFAGAAIRVFYLVKGRIERFAFERCVARAIDDRIGVIFFGEFVVAQRSLSIAFQFSNVPEIIKSEGILRIKQIGLIEELLGLVAVSPLKFSDTFAVQLLGGRRDATPRNRNLHIASEGDARSDEQLRRHQTGQCDSSCDLAQMKFLSSLLQGPKIRSNWM